MPYFDPDPDAYRTCPFDPLHRVPASRFQRHLIKCRKNHTHSDLVVCKFNNTHWVPKAELGMHMANCADRAIIERDIHMMKINAMKDENRKQGHFHKIEVNDDWNHDPSHVEFWDDDNDWDNPTVLNGATAYERAAAEGTGSRRVPHKSSRVLRASQQQQQQQQQTVAHSAADIHSTRGAARGRGRGLWSLPDPTPGSTSSSEPEPFTDATAANAWGHSSAQTYTDMRSSVDSSAHGRDLFDTPGHVSDMRVPQDNGVGPVPHRTDTHDISGARLDPGAGDAILRNGHVHNGDVSAHRGTGAQSGASGPSPSVPLGRGRGLLGLFSPTTSPSRAARGLTVSGPLGVGAGTTPLVLGRGSTTSTAPPSVGRGVQTAPLGRGSAISTTNRPLVLGRGVSNTAPLDRGTAAGVGGAGPGAPSSTMPGVGRAASLRAAIASRDGSGAMLVHAGMGRGKPRTSGSTPDVGELTWEEKMRKDVRKWQKKRRGLEELESKQERGLTLSRDEQDKLARKDEINEKLQQALDALTLNNH